MDHKAEFDPLHCRVFEDVVLLSLANTVGAYFPGPVKTGLSVTVSVVCGLFKWSQAERALPVVIHTLIHYCIINIVSASVILYVLLPSVVSSVIVFLLPYLGKF